MENLDLFYRTFEAYKKEISADPESAKFCRISKRQSDIENESLNIIFSTVDIDESWVNAIEKGLPYIEKAIKEERKWYIEYYSKNNDISKRIIHPYALILLNNQLGVAAYCELKDEIRHFYLKRIKMIKILDKF